MLSLVSTLRHRSFFERHTIFLDPVLLTSQNNLTQMEGKKRPRGLKATKESKQKRTKLTPQEEPEIQPVADAEEATIALQDTEEGNEISELSSIYESAVAKQGMHSNLLNLILFNEVLNVGGNFRER